MDTLASASDPATPVVVAEKAIDNLLAVHEDADQQIKLKQEEAAWVKQRSKCQSNQDCLFATYKSRIEQLQMVP